MKKLLNSITKITSKVENTLWLRVLYFSLILLVLIALALFTDGQKIEFVYNDF